MVWEQRPHEALKIRQHVWRKVRWPHKPVSLIPLKQLARFHFGRTTSVDLQQERLQVRWSKTLDQHIDQFRDTRLSLDSLEHGITHHRSPF
jgi:hypothetical protein